MRSELGVRVGTGLGVVGSEGSRSTAPEAEGLLHGLHGTEVAQCLGGHWLCAGCSRDRQS